MSVNFSVRKLQYTNVFNMFLLIGIFALNLKGEFARCCPCMKKAANVKSVALRAPISTVQKSNIPNTSRGTNSPLMTNGAQTWATDVHNKLNMVDLNHVGDSKLPPNSYEYRGRFSDDSAHHSLLTHR